MSTAAPLQTHASKSQLLSNSTYAGLLLQRKCACGSPAASLTDECAECKSKKRLQAKLAIGASNDALEQEADRVADRVSAAPANPAVSGASLHIRSTAQLPAPAGMAPASVDQVLAGPGTPLDPALKQDMEQRFGHDFSRVRVHSGGDAEQSALDVNARAYTVGPNVVFGARQFAPSTFEGRRLLAHELTHVIQQGGADHTVIPDTESDTGDSGLHKRQTSAADETIGNTSRPVTPTLSSALRLQRAACPCCADSIGISNITRIDTAARMGHSFDVSLNLSYPASGPEGSCTLEWWEKTNVPYTTGMAANTWTNMFALVPTSPTFNPWNTRAAGCATTAPVTITDPPSLGRSPGRTVTRTLEFRLVINSMPPTSESGCAAASQQVTAKQVLTMVSGAPDWAASSFATP